MKQPGSKESPNHSPFGSTLYAVAKKYWQYTQSSMRNMEQLYLQDRAPLSKSELKVKTHFQFMLQLHMNPKYSSNAASS